LKPFSAELILICNSLDAGGIERVVSTLANEWSRQGRKICVVTLHDLRRFYALDPAIHHIIIDRARVSLLVEWLKKLKSWFENLSVAKRWLVTIIGAPLFHIFSQYLYLGFYRLNFHVYLAYEAWALRRVLKRVESPVIVSFGTAINVMTLKACRRMNTRVIISERNDPNRLVYFQKWNYMSRKHYRDADLVTANTRSALVSMEEFVERERLAFVPNPLVVSNGNGNPRKISKSVSMPNVLTVGRMVRDKAHDVLLDAFAITGDELKDWRLSIVGDGVLKNDLRAQAERLGISHRVDWHGVVADPHTFYRSAGMFVLPSRVEGTPNALLEAMSCGLPVIVSNGAPGLLEVVEDGKTGLVVPVNDATALAKAMCRLRDDDNLRGRLGRAAKVRVEEFHLPRAIAKWESIIGWRN
jgi:GalNAc-alpha-(1->4)-GalNAc-alpha-(1->3)-diNAcBac-PP-undecaprenol alpha-1,4-N-acetyl-D-galactosaminyltransferase